MAEASSFCGPGLDRRVAAGEQPVRTQRIQLRRLDLAGRHVVQQQVDPLRLVQQRVENRPAHRRRLLRQVVQQQPPDGRIALRRQRRHGQQPQILVRLRRAIRPAPARQSCTAQRPATAPPLSATRGRPWRRRRSRPRGRTSVRLPPSGLPWRPRAARRNRRAKCLGCGCLAPGRRAGRTPAAGCAPAADVWPITRNSSATSVTLRRLPVRLANSSTSISVLSSSVPTPLCTRASARAKRLSATGPAARGWPSRRPGESRRRRPRPRQSPPAARSGLRPARSPSVSAVWKRTRASRLPACATTASRNSASAAICGSASTMACSRTRGMCVARCREESWPCQAPSPSKAHRAWTRVVGSLSVAR